MAAREDRRIPDLVSITEAATMLGKSRQAINKMIDHGQLAGRKVGETWVLRRAEVERHNPGTNPEG